MNLLVHGSHMNNAGTHSAVQSAVALPAWGDACTDRLGYDGAGRLIGKRYFVDCGSSSSIVSQLPLFRPALSVDNAIDQWRLVLR